MIEKIKTVNNPLTIIAIFAALAEIAGTVALATVSQSIQEVFVWFVMAFPTLIVLLFFATLNWNSKVLYAPSDFKNEENYMHTIAGKIVERKLDAAINLVNEETAKLDDSNSTGATTTPPTAPAQPPDAPLTPPDIKSETERDAEFNKKVAGVQETLDNLRVILNEAKNTVVNDELELTALNLVKLQNDVLRALKDAGRPLQTAEIAGLLQISPTLALQVARIMSQGGLVTIDARNKVRLKQLSFNNP